jgi:hypothetical protein
MTRWNTPWAARGFGAEAGESGEEASNGLNGLVTDGTAETPDADYAFEGYSVEFLDKVMLMPISPTRPK